MNAWQHWADATLPDSIRQRLKLSRTVSFGVPEDHAVRHTKDSHVYTLYTDDMQGLAVRVNHGGGTFWLTTIHGQTAGLFIRNHLHYLKDAALWELLDLLFEAYRDGRNAGNEATETEYRTAFAAGRLKKRKVRGQSAVKVWIERKQL